MASDFDPYHKWLGIPPEEQPPNHYRLLGIKVFEADPDVIEAAADQRMLSLRTHQSGEHSEQSQNLLNEVATARLLLLQPAKKDYYDERLRHELKAAEPSPPRAVPLPAGSARTAPASTADSTHVSRRSASKVPLIGIGVAVVALVVVLLVWGGGGPPEEHATTTPDELAGEPKVPPPPAPKQPDVQPGTEPDHVPPASTEPAEPASPAGPVEIDPAPASALEEPGIDTSMEPIDPLDVPAASPPEEPEEATVEPAPTRTPVPAAADQAAVVQQLREVYDLDKRRSNEQKIKLAKELYALGSKDTTDQAERFVLWRQASEIAQDGGDGALMFRIVDAIGDEYELDILLAKGSMLKEFCKRASDTAEIRSAVTASRQYQDQAIREDRLDLAVAAAKLAHEACVKPAGREFRKAAYDRVKQLEERLEKRQKLDAAVAAVEANPYDIAGNLYLAQLYCFEQGDWRRGLPHLAKCGDAELAKLAEDDLKNPDEASEQLELADAWWDLAQTREGNEKDAVMLRAGQWYKTVLPNVTSSLEKVRVDKRVAEISKLERPTGPIASTAGGDAPPPAVTPWGSDAIVDVFVSGRGGYGGYRIPAMVRTDRNTLLAFSMGASSRGKVLGDVDLVLRRSTDGGKTWEPMQRVHEEGATAQIAITSPCPVVDRTTGVVWLAFCRNSERVFMTHSRDDGRTWRNPTEITTDVKEPEWVSYATGPGHGIQLSTGRLVVPGSSAVVTGGEEYREKCRSLVIYSDDHGRSWQLGGVTSEGMNVCQVVERTDGSLLLSIRNYLGRNQRAFAVSTDAGLTWSEPRLHPQVACPACQASICRYSLKPRSRIVYSGPGGPGRTNLTVRLSYDEGETWPVAKVLYPGPAAFSDLVVLPDGTIGCLWERDDYDKISFTRFTLAWLTDGKDAGPAADLVPASPTAGAAGEQRGLLAHWSFDGLAAKRILDRSTNGLHAEVRGKPRIIEGVRGNAMIFDGKADYLVVQDTPALDFSKATFSVVASVKIQAHPNDYQIIIGKADFSKDQREWALGVVSDRRLELALRVDGRWRRLLSEAPLVLKQWYHVASVANSGLASLYIDGELAAHNDLGYPIPNTACPLTIGGVQDGKVLKLALAGALDELSVYDQALSAEDVKAMYSKVSGRR